MEEGREGDIRVPLISAFFCLLVITGGVFLIIYVYMPENSQPWYPIVALLLIGSPWIFWFLTYMYTCMKACCRRGTQFEGRPPSKRVAPRAVSSNSAMNRTVSTGQAAKDDNDNKKDVSTSPGQHVHFGEVVVMEGDDGDKEGRGGGGEDSVNSEKEMEKPLKFSSGSS